MRVLKHCLLFNEKDIQVSLQENMKYRMFGGIFPEINRCYVTVDNKLYLWDYHHTDRYEA